MFIIAERINSTRKPIREALGRRDVEFLQKEAKNQAEAGIGTLDLNAAALVGEEIEVLPWLVDLVQEVVDVPLCIDSPSPDAARAALERVKTRPVYVNSISAEAERYDDFLPIIKEYEAGVVALCCDDRRGMAKSAEDKIAIADELLNRLDADGFPLDKVYVDPLVFPVGTDPQSAVAFFDAITEIMKRFPQVHTTAGLSNISYGLPERKLLNRIGLAIAIAAGLDSAIMDPLDIDLMASLLAAEALIGRDDFCANFIGAHRAGKLRAAD